MAYNPYFMQNYSQNYPQYSQMQGQQQAPMMPQPQNAGLVSVRNETEARNYPVALGNSVTFKDETAPYVYTKTMGFSQLDRPVFDKYRLVKENPTEASNLPQNDDLGYEAINSTLNSLKAENEAIWKEIEDIKAKENVPKRNSSTKREKDGDD